LTLRVVIDNNLHCTSALFQTSQKGGEEMRTALILLTTIATLGILSVAFASNNVIVFEDGAMGKITFDGKMHNEKLGSGKCMDCHMNNEPFPMKKPGAEGSVKVTAPHKPGEFCGTCHDGNKAFNQMNCMKCHKKGEPAAGGYGAPSGGYGK
jgi:c(7)-type cytochrome triheme protein